MIAAFITASVTTFLAEPVKTFFENRTRKNNLKIILYKELLINYEGLLDYISEKHDVGGVYNKLMMKHGVRTEGFRHAMENELSLFYQLPESIDISILHNRLLALLQNTDYGDEQINTLVRSDFNDSAKEFIETFALYLYKDRFDNKLIQKLVSKDEYLNMLKMGGWVDLEIRAQEAS